MRLIEFDLNRAKNGAKLITRDGHEARIVCYDKLGEYPLIACIKYDDDYEDFNSYTKDGRAIDSFEDSPKDLFIYSDAELTEFEAELDNIVRAFSKDNAIMDDNEVHHYANKLLRLAKKEISASNEEKQVFDTNNKTDNE